ncbi:ISAs1 family transposase [Paraburkholderia sp. RL17-337-BIB-A]|uniref:ISAs1 family transposase n=1 Tax=Paraburkholderia sp. RL17-337-BIB-A TaxID=3031636 RepID=UPI0038B71224
MKRYRWLRDACERGCRRTRKIARVALTQRRYYISSLPTNACRVAYAVRSHRCIENNPHWVLDVSFDEDQYRAKVEHAAQNFAMQRRVTMNLCKRDTRTKVGLKMRRLKAGANNQYRAGLSGL